MGRDSDAAGGPAGGGSDNDSSSEDSGGLSSDLGYSPGDVDVGDPTLGAPIGTIGPDVSPEDRADIVSALSGFTDLFGDADPNLGYSGYSPEDIDWGITAAQKARDYATIGDYAAAAGWGLASAISSVTGYLGSTIGSESLSALGATVGGLLGPIGSLVGAVIGGILGGRTGYNLGVEFGNSVEQALASGYISQDLASDIAQQFGGDDKIEFFVNSLSELSSTELTNLIQEALFDSDQPAFGLYRRRSNVIGSGRRGLTIE